MSMLITCPQCEVEHSVFTDLPFEWSSILCECGATLRFPTARLLERLDSLMNDAIANVRDNRNGWLDSNARLMETHFAEPSTN